MPYKKLPRYSEELRLQKKLWRVETMDDLVAGLPSKESVRAEFVGRFWQMVNVGGVDECWIWKGTAKSFGYGFLAYWGIKMSAHRLSFLIHNNTINPDLVVMHSCDNPACVNPNHLTQGTQGENVRDSSVKGRINRKLTEEQVLEIRSLRKSGCRVVDLSKRYGLSSNAICKITLRQTYKHLPQSDMKTSILIVSFKRDFPYLRFCFRSISKFARGFHRLHILVPTGQGDEVRSMESIEQVKMPMLVSEYDEWPDRPMVHHMRQILYSDEWAFDSDFITHIDSDCVFRAPVTPDDYISDGNPYLRYERFDRLGARHPGAGAWQEPTQRCLPFPVWAETMRSHGATFHRGLYAEARKCIEKKVGISVDDYMKTVRPTYPEGISEFNVLGNVAMNMFPDKYIMVEQFGDRVNPDPKLDQLWSRGPIDAPQKIWLQGEEREVIPIQHFASLGLV